MPTLPDRIRLPLDFDPAPLAAALTCFEEDDWTRHFVRDNYDGEWCALPLRAPAGETHPLRLIYPDPGATRFVDTPLLDRAPALRSALLRIDCPLRSVRLMKLTPGSRIKPHVDAGLDAESGQVRLHLPLTGDSGVAFYLNGTRVPMALGSLWYLRLTDLHSVEHRGAVDRVHLVVDAAMNGWLERKLRFSAARSGRPEDRGGCSRW